MRADPATLAVFHHRLAAIAEEMGTALARSSFSPNIRERRDFSCALFDADGAMSAHAAHIPVHLGSTPLSVRAAIREAPMAEGDIVILNDPYAGGTHLPDVTLVMPVFYRHRRVGYVANRAHHADIGGMAPGSMPLATEIFQEGVRIPPLRLAERKRLNQSLLALLLANVRGAEERRGDLLAQVSALRLGATRLCEVVKREGVAATGRMTRDLQDYAERLTRAVLGQIRPGRYTAEDVLDDDGCGTHNIRLRVAIQVGNGSAVVDFSGSHDQVRGGVNANEAITLAAVFYTICCLAPARLPANAGVLRPIRVVAPLGSVVNARFPAAVAAGNVETSQRLVDVIFRAFARALPDRIPAASNGSMNNVAIGGYDPFRRRQFAYYETIAGGAGAGPLCSGASGIHTHMTNTLNTPIEALEAYYPLRVTRYALRRGSGGSGRHRGGDGVVREIELLTDAEVSILTERRTSRPPGVAGGRAGKPGKNAIQSSGKWRALPAKRTWHAHAGDRLSIATPGGGAWGRPRRSRRPRPKSK
jgi:N-methylhydantoinase B